MTPRTEHRRSPGAWRRTRSGAALLAAALALGACTVERPEPIACNVEPYLVPAGVPSRAPAVLAAGPEAAPPLSAYERSVRDSLAAAFEPLPHRLEAEPAVAPKTLALSGGGPWGAYGAGFMKAWRDELGGFPRFATVTGVSTGALQATFAFLGGENLDRLDALYRRVENPDIFAPRSTLLALLRGNAFNSLDPLRELIREEIIRNGWLEAVAAEAGKGRKLFTGVVDLDSGALRAADLTAVASAPGLSEQEKLTCYTELLVASSAVPVAFDPVATERASPPRKRLLVDGGVRAAAFIESAERALAALAAQQGEEAAAFDGETVVVINGTLAMCQQTTRGGLLNIGKRSIGALVNQNNLNSLSNILTRRATDGQCTRYTFVAPSEDLCAVDADTTTFNTAFMNLLADRGKARWQSGQPFMSVGTCGSPPE